MTTIVVTATKTVSPAPSGVTFNHTEAVVTDNSGAVLPTIKLSGSEATPWSATVTGAAGSGEASVVFTDIDTTGATIGTPVTVTETGTGGQGSVFPATTAGSITVS